MAVGPHEHANATPHGGGGGGGGGGGPLETLTVTIVCCNNEDTIGRCAASASRVAQHVIALDSGSTDGTIDVLRAHGVEVIEQPWLGFVKQKQAALDRVRSPWALHLDSDESLEPELEAEVRRVVSADPEAAGSAAGFFCNRKIWWAGRALEHTWQPEWRLRLAHTRRARWAGYDPHDELIVEDANTPISTGRLAGDMRHEAIADLQSFLARQVKHAGVAADSYLRMGRRGSPAKLVTSPAGTMLKMLVLKGGLRDGWRGWCAATAAATGAAMKHAILLERSHGGRAGDEASGGGGARDGDRGGDGAR